MEKKYYYVAIDPECVCEDCLEMVTNTSHRVIVVEATSENAKCECEEDE